MDGTDTEDGALRAKTANTNSKRCPAPLFTLAFKVLLGTHSAMMRGQQAPVYNRFVQSEQGGNP